LQELRKKYPSYLGVKTIEQFEGIVVGNGKEWFV
jgi:hypothetical protein